jgi:hypothetical protein
MRESCRDEWPGPGHCPHPCAAEYGCLLPVVHHGHPSSGRHTTHLTDLCNLTLVVGIRLPSTDLVIRLDRFAVCSSSGDSKTCFLCFHDVFPYTIIYISHSHVYTLCFTLLYWYVQSIFSCILHVSLCLFTPLPITPPPDCGGGTMCLGDGKGEEEHNLAQV